MSLLLLFNVPSAGNVIVREDADTVNSTAVLIVAATAGITEQNDVASAATQLPEILTDTFSERSDIVASLAQLTISALTSVNESNDSVSATAGLSITVTDVLSEASDIVHASTVLSLRISATVNELFDVVSSNLDVAVSGHISINEPSEQVVARCTIRDIDWFTISSSRKVLRAYGVKNTLDVDGQKSSLGIGV